MLSKNYQNAISASQEKAANADSLVGHLAASDFCGTPNYLKPGCRTLVPSGLPQPPRVTFQYPAGIKPKYRSIFNRAITHDIIKLKIVRFNA